MPINNSLNGSNAWISCLNPNPQAKLCLFFFPYAGTGASVFHPWSKLLPPEIESCLIHLPGRERRLRENSYTHLVPLVEALADAIHPYLDKPFAFFGHSMGGLICFELARRLRQNYQLQPVHLFISGRRAPQLSDSHSPLHHLPDPIFLKELQHRYNGIPAMILQDTELRELYLPILRADLTVIETYHYQHDIPLDCPISVFGGRQDNTVTEEDLAAWRNQTQGAFRLRTFPGDHFFIQNMHSSLIQAFINDLTHSLASRPPALVSVDNI